MPDELRVLQAVADETELPEETRIHVRGKSTMTCLPDMWQIDLYNIGSDDLAAIKRASNISIRGKRGSILCSGSPVDILQTQDGKHQITSLLIVDGDRFWKSSVSLSVRGGADAVGVVRALLNHSTNPIPLAACPLTGLRIPRGLSFYGRTADAVSNYAKAFGCRAYTFRDSLHIVQLGVGTAEMTIRDEDMLSDPSILDGAASIATDVVGMMIGRRVTVVHDRIGGIWRLISQYIDADNRSGPWRCDLMLANEATVAADPDSRWEGIL